MKRTLIAIAALVATAAPAIAVADKCDDATEKAKKGGKNFHIEYRNGQKVTVIDTVVSVCGKVPRPSVAYITTAKSINYEWENLKQDFIPLILATVKKNPF